MNAIAPPHPAVRHAITWTDLLDGRMLPGGDRILALEERGALPAERIGITLELGPGRTAWKGVQAGEILLCQCEGTLTHSAARIDLRALLTRPLTLWKAQSPGLHRPAYTLPVPSVHLRGGSAWLLRWLTD